MRRRYRYRAYLDGGQQQTAARLFGCCRVVWNDALAARETARRAGVKPPSRAELSKALTAAKRTPDRAFLSEVSSVPLQQSLADLANAYDGFFTSLAGKRKGRRVGAPRFKKKTSRQTARFTRNAGFVVETPGGRWGWVRLPKIGRVRFRYSRDLPAEVSSVTLIHEPDGRYYVSFVTDIPTPAPSPEAGRVAGIDLGLTDLAAIVYSDGTREKVLNPRHLARRQRKLSRTQRALSRTQKGSANRAKARRKVAIAHRKTRDARADHHRKLAVRLCRDNQTIAVETLSIAGLARTRNAKSVHDTGWGILLTALNEAAQRLGRTITPIGRWEPTSQVCSVCGHHDGPKPLKVRHWRCPICHTLLDRDWNAAVNIVLAAGLADHLDTPVPGNHPDVADTTHTVGGGERLNACRGSIRRHLAVADPMKQEPTEQPPPTGEAA